MDEVVASFMPVVEQLDLSLDQIEDEIFGKYASGTLEKLFSIKRSVLYLRRILAPQREALNKLARDQFEAIDEQDRIYFRDVYDHLVRMYDITESVRELASGALDSYLSVTKQPAERRHEDADHHYYAVYAYFIHRQLLWDEFLPTGHPIRRLDGQARLHYHYSNYNLDPHHHVLVDAPPTLDVNIREVRCPKN